MTRSRLWIALAGDCTLSQTHRGWVWVSFQAMVIAG